MSMTLALILKTVEFFKPRRVANHSGWLLSATWRMCSPGTLSVRGENT